MIQHSRTTAYSHFTQKIEFTEPVLQNHKVLLFSEGYSI